MSAFSIGATLLDAMVLALLTKEDTYGLVIYHTLFSINHKSYGIDKQ